MTLTSSGISLTSLILPLLVAGGAWAIVAWSLKGGTSSNGILHDLTRTKRASSRRTQSVRCDEHGGRKDSGQKGSPHEEWFDR